MTLTTGSQQISGAARDGAVSFIGSMLSAAMGFALTVVVARQFGVSGSGVFFQAIGIFSIAFAISRLGSDTTAMWMIPRLRYQSPSLVPAGLTAVLIPAFVVPCAAAVAWLALVWLRGPAVFSPDVDRALTLSAFALPFAGLMVTAVAATRAFGNVLVFNLVQNVAVPVSRVIAIPLVVAAGGGAVGAAVAWSWLFLPAAIVALAALGVLAVRSLPEADWRPAMPDRAVLSQSIRFGLPRTVSAAAEQASMWLGVILVGATAGDVSAGGFGAAARFVGAGYIVGTAVRIAVAPRFSALLARGRVDDVAELYSVSSAWILLFGSPIYFILAINAETVLGRLGKGFDDAAPAMVILCVGAIVFLASGNVQSLLLMSGGSMLAALNKLVSVVVLAGGTLFLMPRWGIEGAAIAWTTSTIVDTALSVFQVRKSTGITLGARNVTVLLLVVSAAVLVPCLTAVYLLGAGIPALIVGTLGSGVTILLVSWVGREQLRTGEFLGALRPRHRNPAE